MAGPIMYSTNPWIVKDIVTKYRNGNFYVWCSEHYNPNLSAIPGTADAAIAPSSSPKGIYDQLRRDVEGEDGHSALIKNYRRKLKSLAIAWAADGSITAEQSKEIQTVINSKSWKIWRPVLFVIPKHAIAANRIIAVDRAKRAGHGPEFQIHDLKTDEFDIIER